MKTATLSQSDARSKRVVALLLGVFCHTSFAIAVAAMAVGLWSGMASGFGRLTGGAAWSANLALTLQFPLLHSWFLSGRGRRHLAKLLPRELGRDLVTTLFATFASLQLLATFLLWSPVGPILFEVDGWARNLSGIAYGASWLALSKSMLDAGLGLQTGWLGWSAVVRGAKPSYGPLPTGGLFRLCRQPIYLSFLLILLTPVAWTPDRILVVSVWGAYCLIGPLLKEARFGVIFGAAFDDYRRRVPYFVPRLPGRRASQRGRP